MPRASAGTKDAGLLVDHMEHIPNSLSEMSHDLHSIANLFT